MKLSEAIRLGAMMKPQVRGAMRSPEGTCAMGAAYDAIGILDKLFALPPGTSAKAVVELYEPDWVPLLTRSVPCPECGRTTPFLPIVCLNDRHDYTREQIADWVETLEPSDMLPELAEGSVAVEVGR